MRQFNRDHLESTQRRLDYLTESNLEDENFRQVFNTFRDTSTPLYNEAYYEFFGTLHTFAYIFAEHKILTAIPKGEVLEIDFQEWVKGTDLLQKELTGYLNF